MDIQDYSIRPSKHFITTWMRKWNYDIHDLRKALENSYSTKKVGKNKYEIYIRAQGKSRKIICAMNKEYKEIFIITGAQGK